MQERERETDEDITRETEAARNKERGRIRERLEEGGKGERWKERDRWRQIGSEIDNNPLSSTVCNHAELKTGISAISNAYTVQFK